MSDGSKERPARRKYEAPVVVALGEIARGHGICRTGSGETVGMCKAGSHPGSSCRAGISALFSCRDGSGVTAG